VSIIDIRSPHLGSKSAHQDGIDPHVFGASPQKVTQLILAQTTRPVVFGLLAGVGLAASLATFLIASLRRRRSPKSCT
jgi:hypothetical protein